MLDSTARNDENQVDELKAGTTLLRGQYRIRDYMVRGGFGITYKAVDSLDREYVIKECFPGALCRRSGQSVQPLSSDVARQFSGVLRHFLKEARRVARLDHPNIVRVHQVFEENDTAYMVMEVVDGDDLLTIIEEDPQRLTKALLHKLLKDALEAISYIHGLNILHRDISPDNLLLDARNHLTLIDFGAAREHVGRENRALSALLSVKDGYSPHEFYLTDMQQTAASDLYSLGATFFHLITGEAPPDSQERVASLASQDADPYVPLCGGDWEFDDEFLATIDRALSVRPQDRFESAEEWLRHLETRSRVIARSEPVPQAEEELSDEAPVPEEGLRTTISRLVKDTNKNVTQGLPGQKDRYGGPRRRRQKAEPETPEVKQIVDIFGNPVKNVDAWMREQDRGVPFLPKAVRGKPKAVQPETTDNPETPESRRESRSSIGRFFSACLPARKEQVVPPLQN